MLTIKDGKKILTTPVSAEDLKDIHIGDVVYLNGDLTTCRDVAHRRLVEEGRPLPVDVKDAAIFHAGPIIRPLEDDKFEMVSVGPTTSMRMEKFEYEFVQKSGVRVIVGKGGMGPTPSAPARSSVPSTVFSLPVTPLWLPPRWRRSSRLSGVTSVCRKLCGTATSTSSAP